MDQYRFSPLNNFEQTMAKYASRFALGLSNSVPGIMVDPSNLRFIDDISQFFDLMKCAFINEITRKCS
jgi:hypothetical protein